MLDLAGLDAEAVWPTQPGVRAREATSGAAPDSASGNNAKERAMTAMPAIGRDTPDSAGLRVIVMAPFYGRLSGATSNAP